MGDNFLEMIKATNISPISWLIGVGGLIAFFFLAMAFFYLSEKLSKKWRVTISWKGLGMAFVFSVSLAILWDRVALNQLSFVTYEQFRQILPFKRSFFAPSKFFLPVERSLKSLEFQQCEVSPLFKAPPLFLFVIESLREDFITKETAPNIFEFKGEGVSFDVAASGGNASHQSWFTLFHSQFPLRFSKKHVLETVETGSEAIRSLKALGYQIHLYTSAELAFYHMGESIFGKDYFLADTVYAAVHGGKVSPAHTDKQVMCQLEKDQEIFSGEGHVFIVFLDATHFGYSWLPETGDKFFPIDEPINYLKAAFDKGSLEGIKNRYRNSIFYVDSLIGSFLKRHERDDAVVVITGDHGEEFYEHGQLFHASNLSPEQIHIPLYYKFGQQSKELRIAASKISSHIDIFPTLIDYVGGASHNLEGQSIFHPAKWPFTITSRYNGGKTPTEFCLQSLSGRAIFHLHGAKSLQISELSNPESLPLFEEALFHLFSKEK